MVLESPSEMAFHMFLLSSTIFSLPSHPMITRVKVGIFKPKSFVSKSQYPLASPFFFSFVFDLASVNQALCDPNWKDAMNLQPTKKIIPGS